ncbi:hypothetical protein EV363DRAFT_1298880 [Boletus edulis]|nr:hypothetical protein EV363DRAFT_1298880 [Boletus edulis]
MKKSGSVVFQVTSMQPIYYPPSGRGMTTRRRTAWNSGTWCQATPVGQTLSHSGHEASIPVATFAIVFQPKEVGCVIARSLRDDDDVRRHKTTFPNPPPHILSSRDPPPPTHPVVHFILSMSRDCQLWWMLAGFCMMALGFSPSGNWIMDGFVSGAAWTSCWSAVERTMMGLDGYLVACGVVQDDYAFMVLSSGCPDFHRLCSDLRDWAFSISDAQRKPGAVFGMPDMASPELNQETQKQSV